MKKETQEPMLRAINFVDMGEGPPENAELESPADWGSVVGEEGPADGVLVDRTGQSPPPSGLDPEPEPEAVVFGGMTQSDWDRESEQHQAFRAELDREQEVLQATFVAARSGKAHAARAALEGCALCDNRLSTLEKRIAVIEGHLNLDD